jgi:AraC family transcriptional regulator
LHVGEDHHALMDTLDFADLPTSNRPLEVLAHYPASATCLPISVMPIAGEAELIRHSVTTTRLLVAQSRTGRRWYQRDGRTRQMETQPRMIEIYEKGVHFDHCRWEGEPGRTVVIEFADEDVQAITHGELQALRLRTQHELFDERVSRITLELAKEAMQSLPNGLVYAQGLSVALIGLLQHGYADGRTAVPDPRWGQLGPAQQKRLVEMIQRELATDLSLSRLAGAVGLSVYHFARVFKATFGITPHRYIQDRRLEEAVKALRSDHQSSIADVALACGFASQSHMTDLMRRRLKITPRALRYRK